MEHRRIHTTREVYAAIFGAHGDSLIVFTAGSGFPGEDVTLTEWGFRDAPSPTVGIRTTRSPEHERHEYWLCVPIEGGDR